MYIYWSISGIIFNTVFLNVLLKQVQNVHVYVTVNLYNQELCIITEFSVIMYNY
jgi:hypothetical protein